MRIKRLGWQRSQNQFLNHVRYISNVIEELRPSERSSSISELYRMSAQMNQKIIEFGKLEKDRLAKDMPLKEMTAAIDENFRL